MQLSKNNVQKNELHKAQLYTGEGCGLFGVPGLFCGEDGSINIEHGSGCNASTGTGGLCR